MASRFGALRTRRFASWGTVDGRFFYADETQAEALAAMLDPSR
jgi:hypothetical protein